MNKRQAKDKAWEMILSLVWAEVSRPSELFESNLYEADDKTYDQDHAKVYEQMELIYNQLVERHGKRK